MAIYLNDVIVIGNLVTDPEVKVTPSGKSVCNFTIGINKNYKKGEPHPIFVKVAAWGYSADFLKRFMVKGSAVLVRGELDINTFVDSNGVKRSEVFISANSCNFGSEKTKTASQSPDTFSAPYQAGNTEFQEIAGDDELPF